MNVTVRVDRWEKEKDKKVLEKKKEAKKKRDKRFRFPHQSHVVIKVASTLIHSVAIYIFNYTIVNITHVGYINYDYTDAGTKTTLAY